MIAELKLHPTMPGELLPARMSFLELTSGLNRRLRLA